MRNYFIITETIRELTMKAKLVSIGNSKGIRIPMTILKQCHIENEVTLEVKKNMIVLKPVKTMPRQGWDNAFRLMHERHEDELLVDDYMDSEIKDWEWK